MKGKKFFLHGNLDVEAGLGANSATVKPKGRVIVDFEDGM